MARLAAKPSADRILDAAEAVFAEHPYAEVSLRMLMAAARVSTTAFYARFTSKEAVVAAAISRLIAELHRGVPLAIGDARDLETGLERGVDFLCTLFAPKKALVRLILSETGGSAAAVAARRTQYHQLVGFFAMRFGAYKRARIADPTALAWALVGTLEIQLVRWAVWNEIDLETLRAQMIGSARTILPRSEKP